MYELNLSENEHEITIYSEIFINFFSETTEQYFIS